MRLLPFILVLLQPFLGSAAQGSCCQTQTPNQEFHQQIVQHYMDLWGGDYALAERIIHTDFNLFADRFPFGPNGSVPVGASGRADFVTFIEGARAGWDMYSFDVRRWVGFEYQTAIRWTLNGIIGANHTSHPTPLPRGSVVQFNGTDFLTLDECTGRIKIVDSAQDQIDLYRDLEIRSIPT